jgi:uncharacterized protein YukE
MAGKPGIVYKFPEMESAAGEVDRYVDDYKNAANTLKDSILSAISSWEGASRDKFVTFLEGAVHEFLHENIPQLVGVVAIQIRESSKHMSDTDIQIAESIPQSLG